MLTNDYNIYKSLDTPDDIQKFFFDEYDQFIQINDCAKIYNYFHDNKQLIEEILNGNK